MKVRDDIKQYDGPWWQERRGTATASNAMRIITPANGKYSEQATGYAHELIAELKDPFYPRIREFSTAAMKNGTIMEPSTRAYYELARDCEVEEVGGCVTDDGRFWCSPDGIMRELKRGVEIKNPLPTTQIKWLLDGGLPIEHKPQIHFSLVVTGYECWDFLSYSPGLPEILIEVRPDEYTEKCRQYMDRFWEEYQSMLAKVEALLPPPPKPVVHDFGPIGTVEIQPNVQESYY